MYVTCMIYHVMDVVNGDGCQRRHDAVKKDSVTFSGVNNYGSSGQ